MPTFELEADLNGRGFSLVAGVDEAGRGPLAGPVVAAAVIFPPELFSRPDGSLPWWIGLVDDSKALTPAQRERALESIEAHSSTGLGMATPDEIDSLGIAEANRLAMVRALEDLRTRPTYVLIDYMKLPECGIPFNALPHGDSLSYSIAAASIVAKVTRDKLMVEADAVYPGYGFARHKGYPTALHLRTLAERGPCRIHRRSFGPVRDCLSGGRTGDSVSEGADTIGRSTPIGSG